MDKNIQVILYGQIGSPYSMKIKSILRYKRILYIFNTTNTIMDIWSNQKFKNIKVRVIPVVEFQDKQMINESTAIIKELDKRFNYLKRPIIPYNKIANFISNLLEDYADEFFMKVMFGMRWNRTQDQQFSSQALVNFSLPELNQQSTQQGQNFIKNRQVDRRNLVGTKNDDLIHHIFHLICKEFEQHLLIGYPYLFGQQPTNADFAFYGQMYQFLIDQTPNNLLRLSYPKLYTWIMRMDDLSGLICLNENIFDENNEINNIKFPQIIFNLLKLCGQHYLPYLQANDQAINNNQKNFSLEIEGFSHTQPAFKWQQKCLSDLQSQLQNIKKQDENQYNQLIKILSQSNCYTILCHQAKPSL